MMAFRRGGASARVRSPLYADVTVDGTTCALTWPPLSDLVRAGEAALGEMSLRDHIL